jgi:Kef-type K+ transport system membrane component KefB
VALARSPVSPFISEGLKPLRDFFLVLFFLMVGTQLEWRAGVTLLAPTLVLAAAIMPVKVFLFDRLFRWTGEPADLASELGVRLGQLSEFGLIIAVAGRKFAALSPEASHLITFSVIVTMIVSAYVVVLKYPTPLATRESLRRD